MSSRSTMSGAPSVRRSDFSTTCWSVILAAGDSQSAQASEALEKLCGSYWYPIYAYVRRKGYRAHDAQDLTQEFFTRLLGRNYLSVADRNRGRFRSFLLGSLEHFLAREWTKSRALKRGGRRVMFSLDHEDAEDRYRRELAHGLTPERIYDRRWATSLLERTMSRLRDECAVNDKSELLAQLEPHLTGEKSEATYGAIAQSLSMTPGAVKVAAHRLRRRFGELLQAEIEDTVAGPDDVADELQYLFRALQI